MNTFAVNCPGCGTEKAHMSTRAIRIGVRCSCGVSFNVDVEAQDVDDWWERS
ncbi:hypothetical protein SAMN05192561_11256 [Halopenitus malekzadehii]|uniref:Uncharacterized protein n=1 Tax=Halopenitus malekzadehii TaxID=1267564 RepID=A0A1H6JF84_9EURY|nr:hypothetical protein SAMN05192561_11256 [Halopenitus malekzadehii]